MIIRWDDDRVCVIGGVCSIYGMMIGWDDNKVG